MSYASTTKASKPCDLCKRHTSQMYNKMPLCDVCIDKVRLNREKRGAALKEERAK